jgi:hypothetical protein
MAAPPPATPPEAIPPDQQEDVERLSKGLSVLLVSKQIPWRIQGELARWDSPEEARNHGPRELDFTDGNHGFTAQSSAFTAMRLLQAVRAARMLATILGQPTLKEHCPEAPHQEDHPWKSHWTDAP